MSGFSNSLYLIFTASMSSESDIPTHTFSKFTKVSQFISSLGHQYQSIIPTIFAILQQLMMDRVPKKFALPTHPSTATALPPPSNLQWTQIRDQTRPETRVWPLPNPKTRVYRRNPDLETIHVRSSGILPNQIKSRLIIVTFLQSILSIRFNWRLSVDTRWVVLVQVTMNYAHSYGWSLYES